MLNRHAFLAGAALLVVAYAPPVPAQDKSAVSGASEAARIVNENVKASGGSHLLSRVRTLSLQGTVAPIGDSASGSFTLDLKTPSRYYLELGVAGKRLIEAYNGKSAWRLDAAGNPATMLGADSQEMLVESAVGSEHLVNLKKDAVAATFIGHAQVQGKDALQVELSSPFGSQRELFFDAASHLLLEDSGTLDGVAQQIFYSGYSPESGVQVPRHIEIHQGGDSYVVTVTTVTVNGSIGERVFDIPIRSQVQLPDLKALFKELDEHQKAVDERQQGYGGTKVEEEIQYGSHGAVKERSVTESKFFNYQGQEISITLKRDGKPLSDADEKKENDDARKHVEEIRKNRAEEAAKKESDRAAGKDSSKDADKDADKDTDKDSEKDDGKSDEDVGIEMFLRIDEFVNPRRERFRGQDVLVFDFEANPEHKPHGFAEKIVQKLAGTIWIDEKALDVVRLEAFFARDEKILGGLLITVDKGTAYIFEQEFVNNDVWLPTVEEVYYGARLLMVKGFRGSDATRYSNYAKFDVDAAYPPAPATPASPTPASSGSSAAASSPGPH